MTETVNAAPTKRLVAYVLTKDIQLEDAVLDLVDNSIDGAKRLADSALAGFIVQVSFSSDSFTIWDNCGGIPYEIARDYAFRFGRLEDYAPLGDTKAKDAVGNFGVGMKRALLKMGRRILIKSLTATRYFEIDIDVDRWMADDTDWHFNFSNIRDILPGSLVNEQPGTSITVTKLHEGVAARFALKTFSIGLRSAIAQKEAVPLMHGMTVFVNKDHIVGAHLNLMQSPDLRPFHYQETLNDPKGKVTLDVYAGVVAEPNKDSAGWYVICNGRTVLRADQSRVTGWGNSADRIPNYHQQYARFRGFVMFASENPDLMPWNTAKSGVDPEHPFYRKALQHMIVAMQQVFDFLKLVDNETTQPEQPLTDALSKMRSVALEKVAVSERFVVNIATKPTPPGESFQWIRYSRPQKQVAAVMAALEVNKPNDAGEQTFDLYYESNVEDK